jgi:hypothetical protein
VTPHRRRSRSATRNLASVRCRPAHRLGSEPRRHGTAAFPHFELHPRRRLALLAVLALARSGTVTRDRLTGLFWPETDAERARRLLSDSVYVLRKTLGKEAIHSAGDDLRLDLGVVRCDVGEFEEALAAGEGVRPRAGVAGRGRHRVRRLERSRERAAPPRGA